ncbi:MAG: phosphodiesterase [Cyanobacteria bacterium P01_C01_bin.69]
MLIAHISDLHVMVPGELAYGVVDTGPMVERAIAHLQTRNPDLIVISGDLVHSVTREEYLQLKTMLAPLPMPVYLMPGNHDSRELIRDVFNHHTYLPSSGYLQYTVENYPLRLIMLDTNVPGEGRGELDAERLTWLDTQLSQQPDKPTLLFMHHPPFTTGIELMDGYSLSGLAELESIVTKYSCIQRIGCGHIHRPIQKLWAGTLAYTVPSPVHQVSLDLNATAKAATFTMEPPAYQLHLWQKDSGLVSHTQYINDYEGPYSFFKPQNQ